MPLPKQHMTAEDYWNLPEGKRAELIDGELWDMAAPNRMHQHVQMQLSSALNAFIQEHRGSCRVYGAPFAVNLFADDTTFVEPDISVICDPSKLSARGCEGAPDLVIEIVSPSNRAMDYKTKQSLYSDAGVREYWIVDPSMFRTTVTRFEQDPAPIVYTFDVPVPSALFPGFEANLGEIVAGL